MKEENEHIQRIRCSLSTFSKLPLGPIAIYYRGYMHLAISKPGPLDNYILYTNNNTHYILEFYRDSSTVPFSG